MTPNPNRYNLFQGDKMTLPNERSNSIRVTRDFLRALLDPKKTPGVPKSVRTQAYRCLKHFPADYEINKVAGKEEVFTKILSDDDNNVDDFV